MTDPTADRSSSSEDRIITVILDGQKEQREALIKQDERTRDLEEGYARISSAITNLLENLSTLAKSFKTHEDNLTAILSRIAQIEQHPRLEPGELVRLRTEFLTADAARAEQRRARTDLRVSLKALALGALFTLLVTLSSSLITLLVTLHVTGR